MPIQRAVGAMLEG
ncbi:hypothetical protein LINPERPRIM_LOCUS19221 [Linum perenne]